MIRKNQLLPHVLVVYGVLVGTLSIKKALEAAKARSELIRVYRGGLEDGWANGFVTALGVEFFALQLIDKACRFDGFNCLRYQDISDCVAPAPYAAFLENALRARGEVKSAFAVDLDSLPSLLRSASLAYPLVSIFYEEHEDVCYIGKVVNVSDSEVRLLEISPDARWDSEPTRRPLVGITRVDIGGAYEATLNLVAPSN